MISSLWIDGSQSNRISSFLTTEHYLQDDWKQLVAMEKQGMIRAREGNSRPIFANYSQEHSLSFLQDLQIGM